MLNRELIQDFLFNHFISIEKEYYKVTGVRLGGTIVTELPNIALKWAECLGYRVGQQYRWFQKEGCSVRIVGFTFDENYDEVGKDTVTLMLVIQSKWRDNEWSHAHTADFGYIGGYGDGVWTYPNGTVYVDKQKSMWRRVDVDIVALLNLL